MNKSSNMIVVRKVLLLSVEKSEYGEIEKKEKKKEEI